MQDWRVFAVDQAWGRMIRFGRTVPHRRWIHANVVASRNETPLRRRFVREKGKKAHEMTNMSESSATPDDSLKPAKALKPKRGAFPTPKSEIDKAKPYIPEADEEGDQEGESDLPTDVDGGKEG